MPDGYVICRNEEQARQDAASRAALLTGLERKLAQGDKALIGNAGDRRFLTGPKGEGTAIAYDLSGLRPWK